MKLRLPLQGRIALGIILTTFTVAVVQGNDETYAGAALGAAQVDSLLGEMTRLRMHAGVRPQPQPQQEETERVYRVVTPQKSGVCETPKPETKPQKNYPGFHAWVDVLGGYQKRFAQPNGCGYNLKFWGAAVGADTNFSPYVNAGIELSARYGNLKARDGGAVKGDLDTYFLSEYIQYKPSNWGHTLIVTGSWTEATLEGSTSGYGLGAAYEVSYDIALCSDNSSILQPLAVVSLAHTELGSYSDSGRGEDQLELGRQSQDSAVVGVGVRWLTKGAECLFGCKANTELRLSVARELGDVHTSATVAPADAPEEGVRVSSSKIGRNMVQLGAGISVPVGDAAQMYVQGNGELREHARSWNLTVGLSNKF